ncbi:hypothetical protein I8748_19115 [Nostoc sp. CENA67]|uniref:Methyltransferase type 11 domain-containing protein n=1 Tax=Amazonocrinis nigriterrae CENA67 TaxID=2794033 RepID=A0A8J7HVZ2_9NOST|nr:hypothetical protein [Amazonocrinis nigriterrae]MBH8564272.1 hypothetical protein [Amazonocrinis nigriterrae CENA67]
MSQAEQSATNLASDNWNNNLSKHQEKLLKDFVKVARGITPFTSNIFLEIGVVVQRALSRKLTNLIQLSGYNKRKIASYGDRKIILNIGCANVYKDTLINADLFFSGGEVLEKIRGRKGWDIDLFVNIDSYDQNLFECADGIVLSHVLEHIYPNLALKVLANCFNYLKPGRCIRTSVPHLEAFNRSDFPIYMGIENRNLARNYMIYGFHHKFMYDAEILATLMKKVGFSEVQQVFYGQGLLNETDEPSHQFESIYLTGVKP